MKSVFVFVLLAFDAVGQQNVVNGDPIVLNGRVGIGTTTTPSSSTLPAAQTTIVAATTPSTRSALDLIALNDNPWFLRLWNLKYSPGAPSTKFVVANDGTLHIYNGPIGDALQLRPNGDLILPVGSVYAGGVLLGGSGAPVVTATINGASGDVQLVAAKDGTTISRSGNTVTISAASFSCSCLATCMNLAATQNVGSASTSTDCANGAYTILHWTQTAD